MLAAITVTLAVFPMALAGSSHTPGSNAPQRLPFSFVYCGTPSRAVLSHWPLRSEKTVPDTNRRLERTTWRDGDTGLRLTWERTRFEDFVGSEWVLYFENTGTKDTAILTDIQALDLVLHPSVTATPRLHRTNGAPSNPTDFAVDVVEIRDAITLSGGGGRSSNKDFPFFKIEQGDRSTIVAVGWSGQWQARIEPSSEQPRGLHVTVGLEKARFYLRPGEKVRTPRILLFEWQGDTLESNAQFRRLIYKHYCAVRSGRKPLPTLYCNTCFTRGGGWLNECNAGNQISLINAYAPLGLEALLTDAGWFEGGWPKGAGNWTPRNDAYPDGMGPVAAAAKSKNMIYGLWFEPERVVAGTWLHRNHPEWLLHSKNETESTYLLNFGLKEVQDYFFSIVTGFMDLPGFRVYRQDFNMNPLPYWRFSDEPDRQGITEMKYIEGLYAYWDRIAATWPDSLRIECSSGGRRIDLETVTRMHVHQKSDYWFDNEVDQASIWGLSQYLPSNVFMSPINRMDDYSFHSAMATSLCTGWIADAKDFDVARGKRLLDRYREVRHLMIGAWYPLLPYSREKENWIASQYHRSDLDEGMILVFRRKACDASSVQLKLHGLKPNGKYELWSDRTGKRTVHAGAQLMKGLEVTLPERPQSDLITYAVR